MASNGHAKLAPSSAYRWLNCGGSVELCDSSVNAGSAYADEGTAGHEIFALVLGGAVLQSFLGKKIAVEGGEVEVTQELLDHVEQAIEWVHAYREKHPEAALFSEHKYEIGEGNFGLPPGLLWGTADFTALSNTELCIADLKLGYVFVEVGENEQLIMYALGVLDLVGWIFDKVRLAILQPKTGEPREIVYTASEMRSFRDAWTPNVLRAVNGGPLVASEQACRFCPAAGTCPELRRHTLELARREFASIITMSGEEIAEILDKGEMIENALKSVRAHALKLLEIDPGAVPGYKRVQGEKKRRWKEEEKALEEFKKSLKLDEIAPRSLVSPLQIEKLLAKGILDEATRAGKKVTKKACLAKAGEVVEVFAEKPEGLPTLARSEDERQALGPTFTSEDLAQLGDGKAANQVIEMID